MNRIKSYNEVDYFLINNSQLIFINENHDLKVPDLKLITSLKNPKKLYFFGEKIIVLEKEDFLFFNDSKLINTGFIGIGLYPLDKGNVLTFKRDENLDKIINLYNNNKQIWAHKFNNTTRLITAYFILYSPGYDDYELILKDIETFKTLWRLDLSELGKYTDLEGEHLGKITGKVLLVDEILVVPVSDHLVLGINTDSGEIIWKKQFNSNYCKVFGTELYVFSNEYYLINPHNGNVLQTFNIPEKLEESGYNLYTENIVKDEFIFTVGRLDTVISQWDKKTGDLIARETLHPSDQTGRHGIFIPANMDCVQYADGKLFVKDSEKTLHVLEVATR